MIRGLFLLAQNKCGFILRDILKNTNINGLVWDIGYAEVFSMNQNNDAQEANRFSKGAMTSEELMKQAQRSPEYYPLFGEFKAFTSKESITSIDTYSDFVDSDCQLIILIADAIYIDIYAKDKETLEQIKKNALELNCTEITDITDENDERYKMYI